MAQVTRENIKSQSRGERLTVISPEHDGVLFGNLVSSNTVVNDNQEYLYVTIELYDGPKQYAAFDIDRALVFNGEQE